MLHIERCLTNFITMKFFLPIIFLQCISLLVLGRGIQPEKIDNVDEIQYKELINLRGICSPWDSCKAYRNDQPHEPAYGYFCSCHNRCWEFGMCCIDSPYRIKPPIQTCRNVGVTFRADNYYMVDRCPDNTITDSIWKIQCEKEPNENDDLLLFAPITSLDTSRTYKNYYCFKCHESTDKYVSWDLKVGSIYSVPTKDMNIYSVSYNQEYKTWEATLEENGISFPANLSFIPPRNIQVHPFSCSKTMIVDCPKTWTDIGVREKCLAYSDFVSNGYSFYKNAHCALCNNASLDDLFCWSMETFDYEVFNFRYLIDVNSSDGDKVGKVGNCDKGYIWDPYIKKCQKNTCAIPGYVIINNRCVLP